MITLAVFGSKLGVSVTGIVLGISMLTLYIYQRTRVFHLPSPLEIKSHGFAIAGWAGVTLLTHWVREGRSQTFVGQDSLTGVCTLCMLWSIGSLSMGCLREKSPI